MASTSAVTILGGGVGPALGHASGQLHFVMGTFTAGATYATGGQPVTLPTGTQGMKLRGVALMTPHDGVRHWVWDGSKTAPKLKAYDAFATEEAAATDVSAVSHTALFVFEG